MLFTPIYIAMTFVKTWRIRSFRARLLEFLSGNTSIAFCKVPENAAETPTLSSKLCMNPKNAYLCDLMDYTNTTRVCSMKPVQKIDISDWVACAAGLPLGSGAVSPVTEFDIDVLFECELEPNNAASTNDITTLDMVGVPVAWKASSHLAVVLKTNIETLSMVGFKFVSGIFVVDNKLPVVRVQTVQLTGEPVKISDPCINSYSSEIHNTTKSIPCDESQWPVYASLLRKLSKAIDSKHDHSNTTVVMNGNVEKKNVTLADISVNTTNSLEYENGDQPNITNESIQQATVNGLSNAESTLSETTKPQSIKTVDSVPKTQIDTPKENIANKNSNIITDNVTVKYHGSPKKSALKLDLKKGTSTLSASLQNLSSHIRSVTTHKKINKHDSNKTVSTSEIVGKSEEIRRDSSLSVKASRPLSNTKSPNVLIYSDSIVARDNLEASLRKVLDCERYTIYSVTRDTLEGGAWRGRAALVAVAGCVGRAAPLLLAHLLDGGKLLALCSDLLHTVLPYYKTAEVRENEIAQFSFDKWKSVKMKHHIFCYQASPAKKQFSTETDKHLSKYYGHPGHELDISVLASEETWKTPSLLKATDLTNGGMAIFSQIHLEADPNDYLGEDGIKSNEARLEIVHKIVGDILGLHVKDPNSITHVDYTKGYFLGHHVDKLALVESLCPAAEGGKHILRCDEMTIQWCLMGEEPVRPPAADFLPVNMFECPEHFSTVDYFDNLSSRRLGRLVVYADVLASTQTVCGARLAGGVAVVARRQTTGHGRANTSWLSPQGQAAVTIQVWQKMAAWLPLVQHVAAVAAVRAVRSCPGYEDIDLRIKWPNDVYYGREVKIGGILVVANCVNEDVIVNIGTGVNVSNEVPTTCINAIIASHNASRGTSLAPYTVERYLARYCSHLEETIDMLADENEIINFLDIYYQYWMHDDEEVTVVRQDGSRVAGRIVGVDECGWLRVASGGNVARVAPDGNTFDIMTGLIAPK